MSYVEDIAASASSSWADSFSSLTQLNFGGKTINFGSGAQSLITDAAQSQDARTASDARSAASTAKTGDGGVATSSASLSELAASHGIDLKTGVIALLCTLAAGLGVLAFFRRKPAPKRKK